jgi:erythronate-4-phosphate dehydrogenase
LPFVQNAFGSLGEVSAVDTAELTASAIRDADVVIIRSPTRIDRVLLEGSRVKFVGTATIGTDHVDLEYLASNGIAFASAPGSNSNSVKEYVVSALLRLAALKGFQLKGLSIGIVGVGHVGSKVHQAAESLGMRVLLNDPPLPRRTGDARYVALEELMEADIITLHVPLTKSGADPTYHLFNKTIFDRLKRGAIFINTSRGSVVETESLKNALADGHVGSCVLDVWENEPTIDVELLESATIGTPHIAGYSMEGKVNAVHMIRDAVCKHFGIAASWDLSAEFGVMEKSHISVTQDAVGSQSILDTIVTRCYDISLDDRALRGITSVDPGERAAYFKKLRSGYRVRREFSNATVELPQQHAHLYDTVVALGFNCNIIADDHAVNRQHRQQSK